MAIHSPNLVVSARRPAWQRVLAGVVVLAVVAATGWLAYRQGLSDAGLKRAAFVAERDSLNSQIGELVKNNAEIRGLLAQAERQLQIDHTAYTELKASLQTSTRQLAELRKELSFYQNIISPPEGRRGIVVQQLEIEALGAPGRYRFDLVVIQAYNHRKEVKGKVQLVVSGTRAGEPQEVRVTPDGDKPLTLDFRYFQKLEGYFDLPEGFRPHQVHVTVTPQNQAPVKRSFDWPLA